MRHCANFEVTCVTCSSSKNLSFKIQSHTLRNRIRTVFVACVPALTHAFNTFCTFARTLNELQRQGTFGRFIDKYKHIESKNALTWPDIALDENSALFLY